MAWHDFKDAYLFGCTYTHKKQQKHKKKTTEIKNQKPKKR
jgi:hypothetical protein